MSAHRFWLLQAWRTVRRGALLGILIALGGARK
jgi:hypothetical protein